MFSLERSDVSPQLGSSTGESIGVIDTDEQNSAAGTDPRLSK